MADETKSKGSSQKTENTLAMIGSIADLLSPVIFGPEVGVDLGAPFKTGAAMLKKKRDQDELIKIFSSTPETAELLKHGQAAAEAGGLLNMGQQAMAPQPQVNAAGVPLVAGGGVDFSSPAFTEALAKGGFGDQALQIGSAKALQKQPDYLDRMEQILGLNLAQAKIDSLANQPKDLTPQEKAKIYSDQRVEEAKQKNLDRPVNSKAQETLQNLNNVNLMMDQFESEYAKANLAERGGITTAIDTIQSTIGKSGDLGRAILQNTDPDLFNVMNTSEKLKAAYVKAISGAQVTDREFQRLQIVQPSVADRPENLVTLLGNARLANRYAAFSVAAMNRANDIESAGFNRDDVDLFADVQTLLRKNQLTDEEKQAVAGGLEQLGLGDLVDMQKL